MAEILFRPVCSNCNNQIHQLINYDEEISEIDGNPRFTQCERYYITPKSCPYCGEYFTRIEMLVALPFDNRLPLSLEVPNCPLKPVEEQKEDTETDRLKNMCRVLFNRCRATGSFNGQMCVFCGMKKECEEMHSI